MKYHGLKQGGIASAVLIFCFSFGLLLIGLFFWERHAIESFNQWPTTDAVVIKRETTTFTNSVSGRYNPHSTHRNVLNFAFTYQVDGRQYTSQKFFPNAAILDHSDAVDYPVGSHFQAHHNPAAPDYAVAESGRPYNRILFIGIFFMGISIAGVTYNFRVSG